MKRVVLSYLFLIFMLNATCALAEEFDNDDWQEIRRQKQEDTYKEESIPVRPPESFSSVSSGTVSAPLIPAILSDGIEMPYESKLAISGRKYIGMKFSSSKYLYERDDDLKSPTAGGFELDQQLQVRVKGTVKRKISVNVDYDDTVENKKDISIVYTGDPDELVQEAAFGDINLSLPGTEFVSYNKAAFGGRAHLRYKKANLYGIFSRTKGTTETKKFTGNTTFEKKDISDISYIRRKYYKMSLDSSHLPIKPGSEKIYLDDRDAANNTVLTSTITFSEYNKPGSTFSVTADLLYAGKDYTIDYEKGVIVFKRYIQQNYIIAVDYEKQDGTRVYNDAPMPSYKLIKDESETLAKELKNYYSIGRTKMIRDDNIGNFILKVYDLSRTERNDIAHYPTNIEVDFEAGVFRFTDGSGNDKHPFPAASYTNIPTHNYIIYTEYRYRTKSYLVRPNIVPQSEEIVMDGRKLARDSDYFMDYDSGFITFMNEEQINDNTQIEVTYEWAPFGGQMEQTVMGIRSEYAPTDNFAFGSTLLYNFPAKPLTAPDIRSTPESISVYEFDTRAAFPNIPLKPSFSGEYAGSRRNPNTFGSALIENMEGIKQADIMPTDKDLWKYGSNITTLPTGHGVLLWDHTDIKNVDINPSVPEAERKNKRQVLNVYYKLTPNAEASIIYPISKIGVDYTRKIFLDFWMYGDGSGDNLVFTVGSLNEDADGDGIMDTEDKNSDGILNPGEDIGIQFNHPDGRITRIGADNGKIDTEDLDGDGVLRRNDSPDSQLFKMSDGFEDENGTVYTSVSWQGWKHFIVPLGNVTALEAVKQVRITVNSPWGNNVFRQLMFSDVSFVGNKWERPAVTGTDELTVSAVNNIDNSGYLPLFNQFPSIYKNLYNVESSDLKEKKEQALSLKYTVAHGSTVSTRVLYTSALDFSKHKELVYFVWGNNAKGATFALQVGADNSYFEHKIQPNWTGWKKIVVKLKDINDDGTPDALDADEGAVSKVGTPAFTNISQVKLLVINENIFQITDGEIYVNEIYLDKSAVVSGYAHRENITLTVPGWLNVGGRYKYTDRDFQTLTTLISNRDTEEISASADMPQFWLLKPEFANWISMPFNVSVSKMLTVTPSAIQTNDSNLVSLLEEGRVVNVAGNAATSITIKHLPKIGAFYGRTLIETTSLELNQRDETNTYTGTLDYTNPLKLYVAPNTINFSYTRTDGYRSMPLEKEVDFSDLKRYTTSWYIHTYMNNYIGSLAITPLGWLNDILGIYPMSNLALNPSYQFNETFEQLRLQNDIENKYPKSAAQAASITSSFSIFPWFQPSASYNININQTYNLTTSTATLLPGGTQFVSADTKTVDRTSGGNINVALTPRDIVSFKPINSLYLNASYEIANGDSYEYVSGEEDVFDKLWIDEDIPFYSTTTAKRKSLTLSDTIRGNAKWLPLEFIKFGGRATPLRTINTSYAYSYTDTRSDVTGTRSRTLTLNWPDITTSISEIEKFLFLEKYVNDTQMNVRFTKRLSDDFAFEAKTKHAETVSNAYDCRFNLLKQFDCYTAYNTDKSYGFDYQQDKLINDGYINAAAFQIGYRLGDIRFTPRYDWRKEYEVDGLPKVIKDYISDTITLGINYDVVKPFTWFIPFVAKRYDLDSRFTATGNLKYIKAVDKIVETNNTNAYSVSLTGDYAVSMSNNLRLNITPSGSFSLDTRRKQESYYSYEISSSLTITF